MLASFLAGFDMKCSSFTDFSIIDACSYFYVFCSSEHTFSYAPHKFRSKLYSLPNFPKTLAKVAHSLKHQNSIYRFYRCYLLLSFNFMFDSGFDFDLDVIHFLCILPMLTILVIYESIYEVIQNFMSCSNLLKPSFLRFLHVLQTLKLKVCHLSKPLTHVYLPVILLLNCLIKNLSKNALTWNLEMVCASSFLQIRLKH